MLSRRITAALAFLTYASSVPAFADFCSGKYESTSEMVDAAFKKYGTLYSGGDHQHFLDDVGATLDLYRLWRGLPDVSFRTPHSSQYDYYERSDPIESLNRRLALVEAPDARGDDNAEERSEVAIELDLATKLTVPQDGWIRSSDHPLFDWLNTVMVASAAPWTISSHLDNSTDSRYPAYKRLLNESLQRFSSTSGLEWAVAAQLLTPPGQNVASVDRLFTEWQTQILSCQATQGEYAAWATSASVRLLLPETATLATVENPVAISALPKSVVNVVAKGIAAEATVERARYSIDVLIQLANAVTDPELAAWIGAGGTYHSASASDLSRVHNGKQISPYSLRAFNLMSVAELTTMWQSTVLPSNVHAAVLGTIFARNVTLGHDDAAYALLGDLKQAFPDRSERVSEIDALWIPLNVKLSLIALENPEISVWLNVDVQSQWCDFNLWVRNSHHSRDLPAELANGVAVQEDFETWLYLPDRWERYRGMHGSDAPLDRIYGSDGNRSVPKKPDKNYSLIPSANTRSVAADFGRLVAWEELAQLVPAQGFTHVISHNIMAWARDESNSWVKRVLGHRVEAAQALRQVVLLNRTNDGGDFDGVPAGKAAFKLLKFGFSNTAAANQTPYWYESHCESEMSYNGKCWSSSTAQATNSDSD